MKNKIVMQLDALGHAAFEHKIELHSVIRGMISQPYNGHPPVSVAFTEAWEGANEEGVDEAHRVVLISLTGKPYQDAAVVVYLDDVEELNEEGVGDNIEYLPGVEQPMEMMGPESMLPDLTSIMGSMQETFRGISSRQKREPSVLLNDLANSLQSLDFRVSRENVIRGRILTKMESILDAMDVSEQEKEQGKE